MGKIKGKRKLFSVLMAVVVACTGLYIPVNAQNRTLNHQEHKTVKIIGQPNDTVVGNYESASINAKLNHLNGDFDAIQSNITYLLENCFSKLTVWINSSNSSYVGRNISLSKNGEIVGSGTLHEKNGHFEAEFSKLSDGTYDISYPYILKSGNITNLSTSVIINGTNVTKQLYGDLFQMSMPEIQQACKDGTIHEIAHVGDTIGDGTYTYTIIGINQDKPSDANGDLLPENSYGDVLTLMAMGAPVGAGNGNPVTSNIENTPWTDTSPMNDKDYVGNYGGWWFSSMRSSVMPEYLEKLPETTRNTIGYVQKIGGDSSVNSSQNHGGNNIITGDKCFLLSVKEVRGENLTGTWDCTFEEDIATFQYAYFKDIATSADSRRFTLPGWKFWWLRSPLTGSNDAFCTIIGGTVSNTVATNNSSGYVLPAFCIY